MRLLESVRVTVFERQVPTLLIAGPLLLEIILSHHVQLSGRRQICPRRRLFARCFADCIGGPLLRCSAVSPATSIERGHAAHDERRHSHQHKKTHRLKFSRHGSGRQPYTFLAGLSQLEC